MYSPSGSRRKTQKYKYASFHSLWLPFHFDTSARKKNHWLWKFINFPFLPPATSQIFYLSNYIKHICHVL